MSLTHQDKIECREIAREIIQQVLIDHVNACPHHNEYLISKARLIGIGVGVIVASSVGSGTAATVVTIFMKAMM